MSNRVFLPLVLFAWLCHAEQPVSVLFDGSSPSSICGSSYTGYSFSMSMSCLAPTDKGRILTDGRPNSSNSIPRSECSANFVTPWNPSLPRMFFIVRITRLRVPPGSRFRIMSVNSFGAPTGQPEVDVFYGDLETFRDQQGSEYVETTGTIRVMWESTNPVVDKSTPCVPYALDFDLSIVAFWPRWVNRSSGAFECPQGSFLCRRIKYCLPKQFVGDDIKHCVDGDDEFGAYPNSELQSTYNPQSPYAPPPHISSSLGAFNSAVFVPLIVFVVVSVFLITCLVRSRAACRQLALRQTTLAETCRHIFCGFDQASIRLSVRPTDRVQVPPTLRLAGSTGGGVADGVDAGTNLRLSNYSASSGFRRWQEQFMHGSHSPTGSVNIISKEFDMSPPSYEEALKMPKASTRSIREWFGSAKVGDIAMEASGVSRSPVPSAEGPSEVVDEVASDAPDESQHQRSVTDSSGVIIETTDEDEAVHVEWV